MLRRHIDNKRNSCIESNTCIYITFINKGNIQLVVDQRFFLDFAVILDFCFLLFFFSEQNIRKLLLEPSRREFIKDLWSGKYGADLSKRPEINGDKFNHGVYGSFRKLEES